ncbi:MAG: transporter substrate-binding domain-containing protein, partial [Verrucomicrobia bacterium]|nr:transporter substrate-binding domain-containing protein [Verrucomicrobiota bacterium]
MCRSRCGSLRRELAEAPVFEGDSACNMKIGSSSRIGPVRRRWLLAGLSLAALAGLAGHAFAQGTPDLLTAEERAWLRAHGPLRYAPQTAAPPFSFLKPDGQAAGIGPDLVELLARRLGTEIRQVRFPSWLETVAAVRTGKVDLLAGVVPTEEREQFLQFIGPYHATRNVLFVNRATPQFKILKDLAGRRVGVTRDSLIHIRLQREHPELVLAPTENAREGLLLLALEQLDAVAASLPVGRYFIADNSLNQLRVLPEVLFESQHHLAVRRGDERLLSILKKGLDSITEPERQQLFARWTGPEPAPPSWRTPDWLWESALAVLAGVLVIVVWNHSLRRRVARQARQIRQQVEEESALERRCTELVENATDMVYTRDFEGNYTSINPAGERILGYAREELLRMNVSQVVVPEHMDRVQEHTAKLRSQETTSYEMLVRTKDGRRVWLETNMRALRKEGQLIGIQGIARDITERKRAE